MLALLVNNENVAINNIDGIDILNLNQSKGGISSSYGKNIITSISNNSNNDRFILALNDFIPTSTLTLLKEKESFEDIIFVKSFNSLDIESLQISDLINLIKEETLHLPSIICISKELLHNSNITDCRNYPELCIKIIFSIITNEQRSLVIEDDSIQSCPIILDNNSRAKLLRDVIATNNIEEVFPNNNWDTFSKESAAVAYHTLCAMFIKFDDLITAKECLNLSSNFEDSPRALALRGLIALKQKQDLNAVANMVSSLHIYEKRKKEDNHLVNFNPQNLDIIGAKLNQGLDALNKKDNHLAATLFADAVYSFDDFFKKQDIDEH